MMSNGFTGQKVVAGVHQPCRWSVGLSTVVSDFGALSKVACRTNGAYVGQLSLIVGLHFAGALVDVYLFCFHVMTLTVPWTADTIGGVRAFNNLWRLSAVSGATHYTVKQVCASRAEVSNTNVQYYDFIFFFNF